MPDSAQAQTVPPGVVALINKVARRDKDTGRLFFANENGQPIRNNIASGFPPIDNIRDLLD